MVFFAAMGMGRLPGVPFLLVFASTSSAVPAAELPGQAGPTADLLQAGELRPTTCRSQALFPERQPHRAWSCRGDQRLASWPAASGIAGSSVPIGCGARQRSSTSGRYLSAWAGTLGEDLWFDLTPR